MEPSTSESTPQVVHAVRKTNSLGIPVAIVIAAALIAGAIVYTGMAKNTGQVANVAGGKDQVEQKTAEVEVAPVTEKDHILGNPNAPVMIVEYSDFDCPFCKNFHETMNRVMDEYGKDGKVSWVYRQFPLEQLHPNAPKIAAASECVANIGGNDAFWKFADLVFGERAVNEPTNINKLADYAVKAGADKAKFQECLESGRYNDFIDTAIQDAMKAGARGTPYSVVIVGDQQGVINGAQPYEAVKKTIDTLIGQISGGTTE